MRNILVLRFLSRSAPIALFAALGAGCSSDVARFSDPFSNPFKSRPQSYAQQRYDAAPQTTASVNGGVLPSADDVVRGRPRQTYAQAQDSYQNASQQVQTGAAIYGREGKAAYDNANAQARSAYRSADTQLRGAAQAPVNRARSAIPNDWRDASAKASPFSADNSDAGLATGSISKPKPGYNWKPGTPYLKQMMMPRAQNGGSGGWTSVGGTAIRVGQGETVATLSRRYGVPATAIAQANGLSPTQALDPGQNVVIPVYSLSAMPHNTAPRQMANPPMAARKAPAPVSASHGDGDITASVPKRPARTDPLAGAPMPSPNSAKLAWLPGQKPAAAAGYKAQGGTHLVAMGDSVNSIARRYQVNADDLARANDLGPNRPLRIGQTLRLPSAATTMTADVVLQTKAKASVAAVRATTAGRKADQTATATITRPAAAKPVAAVAAESRPAPAKVVARAEGPAQSVAPPSPTAAVTAAPNFRWPVKGRVIGNFIPGQRDGIALAVPEGTTVRASDDGVVTYAGNELKGYGNVVLIRHPSGYVTAYAHNSELLVKRGDEVKRGQVISLAGQTGGVNTPQLHFEIRKGQDAINPMAFLKN